MLLDDIEHLPKVVTNVLGIKDVLLAIEPEIIQLRQDISDLIKELYVKTTEDFITRWEKDFSLKYDASLTLEQRRQRILNKLARKRPLTWNNLRLLIKNNLAENVQFYLSNDSANYRFKIIINPEMEEVFDPSNFTVVGSPTITDDGIASGFSSSNYLKHSITTTGNSVKIKIRIKTSTLDDNIHYVLSGNTGDLPSDAPAMRLLIANTNKLWLVGYTSSGAYTNVGNYIINADTEYLIEAEYTSSKITYKVNNIDVATISGSYKLPKSFLLGKSNDYFTGSIDLKQFSITVDGKIVLNGTKRVPKGISEMEKAVRQAKPAYLLFDIIVTDIVRRCGTFNCGTNPL